MARSLIRRDEVLDDWDLLRSDGVTRRQAAPRIGISLDCLEKHIYRGARAGDSRAVLGTRDLAPIDQEDTTMTTHEAGLTGAEGPPITSGTSMSASQAARDLTHDGYTIEEARGMVSRYLDDVSARIGVRVHQWGLDDRDVDEIARDYAPVAAEIPAQRTADEAVTCARGDGAPANGLVDHPDGRREFLCAPHYAEPTRLSPGAQQAYWDAIADGADTASAQAGADQWDYNERSSRAAARQDERVAVAVHA